ncbi:MAG TPA: GDSL-type esterase/lipase family protein [Ilumatobacteraceae bacterium]|nr:GDSL-type esterase/lipase family protein [Ilumatobacteraceae bacterium]
MFRSSNSSLSTRRQFLRAGVVAVAGSWVALELTGQQRVSAEPTGSTDTRRISLVGDSLTVGTMPYQSDDLRAIGWSRTMIDAYASRGVRTKVRHDLHTGLTAVDAIRESWGDTEVWIVGLGTNDALIYSKRKNAQVITEMMDRIGRGHKVMWINVYLPQRAPQATAWNASLDEVAAERDDMYVFDWAGLAFENKRWLASDSVHLSALGYQQRSAAVARASRYLQPAVSSAAPRGGSPATKPPAV